MKFWITTFFVILLSSVARGQPQLLKNTGFKTGLNLARFIEDGTNNNFLVSYSIGLTSTKMLTNRLGLALNILYSRQGNMNYLDNPGLFDRVRTRYNYINLPLSLRYSPPQKPLTLSAGLQFGYLIINRTDFLPNNGYSNNNLPYLKRSDFGYLLAAGLRFTEKLNGEIQYYNSIFSLLKESVIRDPSTGAVSKIIPRNRLNQVISFSVTYFPFK